MPVIRRWRFVAPVAVCAALALLSVAHFAKAESGGWKPDRTAEIVVTAGPGGNQDLTARAIEHIWREHKIVPSTIVRNKPGGGGAIASAYVKQHAGDPHFLLMVAPTLLTSRIMGRMDFRHDELSPVATLYDEYIFVSVKSDSPMRSGTDLIANLKSDPASARIAVASALGNHIHMGIALPMKAAGVDIRRMKVVAFKSSGQSMTALLGGHVDVAVSTLGTVLPHLEAGKVRVLGVSAPKRLGGNLAGIPTWIEQGARASFSSWRAIAAAPGVGKAQVAYWEAAMVALVRTPEWKADLARNHRESQFLSSEQTRRFLDAEYRELEAALGELGLAKSSR